MTTPSWPDTHRVEPPAAHLYGAAVWLLGRHEDLARLTARVAGVVTIDVGEASDALAPHLDLDALAEAFEDLDGHRIAWRDYQHAHPAPLEDAAYDEWHDAGPSISRAARDIAVMSFTEKARLRLLATFAGRRVRFSVDDLFGFDDAGQALITDWCRALQAR